MSLILTICNHKLDLDSLNKYKEGIRLNVIWLTWEDPLGLNYATLSKKNPLTTAIDHEKLL